jgi:poly(hydroxyalkanoate) depolymerase family esterase
VVLGAGDTIRRALARAGLLKALAFRKRANDDEAPAGRLGGRAIPGKALLRPDGAHPGQFVARSFANKAGARDYKLYIPAGFKGQPAPLIVMLHGCTQSPDDFSRGTRMNELADAQGLLILYPGQTSAANGMKCWNWFKPDDQTRGHGEPSIIAGITQQIASEYAVDRQRVFVAGLSAGASMAVILGATYPELYAAVCAHSGLPYLAARSVASAMAAMQSGAKPPLPSSNGPRSRRSRHKGSIPTIVFHGDRDSTVNIDNGAQIVAQAVAHAEAAFGPLQCQVRKHLAAGGREVTTTVYSRDTKPPIVEYWQLGGAGHAWSGGSPNGSFTDSHGPDASSEMMRFFLAQRRKRD